MQSEYEEAVEILKKYKQEHIISFLEKLEEKDKQALVKQVLSIDFNQIMSLYEKTKKGIEIEEKNIEPIQYLDKAKLSEEEKDYYNGIGKKAIQQGKYAFATMAGGQGTRLGCNGPKGKFILDVEPKSKSLFEILSDKLKSANKEYNVVIPWYIMTSRENNKETIEFFEENNYFGYPKNDIKFFMQGELPLIDTKGKLLIDKNKLIKEASDGNGGIYSSMKKSGIIEDMKARGVEWIFIGGVDNVLLRMVDVLLLGIAIDKKREIAAKSVVKSSPKERVGVFCKNNGKPKVIEYTELPEEMSEMVDDDNELLYGESHVMCNLFNITAIEKISNEELPYHSAFKKANYINEKGEFVKQEKENAYKFESFIFDPFELFEDMSILRVKREEEFAPVKNKEGNDSPETATILYNNARDRM